MTIAQVGPYPLSEDCIRGGIESSVFGLTKVLCLQHIVDVFDVPRIEGKDCGTRREMLTIHRYKNTGKYNQDALQRADEVLRDIIAIHPDIVHIHGTGEYSAYIYRAIKHYGIKVVLTVHGLLHIEKKNMLRRNPSLKHLYQYIIQSHTEFSLLDSAEHVIVDTEYVAEQIKDYFKSGKIAHLPWMYVIPQGIHEDFLHINSNPQTKTILSVGSISRRKGHLYLLRAFEQVCRAHPSVQLIIAGTLSEPEYLKQMQSYIASSIYGEQMHLFTNLTQDKLLTLYGKASIFALHSQEESQGIVLAEAMAAGLPIVSTTVGGIPYVVQHNKTGLLSPFGDVNKFAQSLSTLLSNEQLRQSMAAAAHEDAKHYIWHNIELTIETVYNRL